MAVSRIFVLGLTLSLSLSLFGSYAQEVQFSDVSLQAGMLRPHDRRIKYGGPAIADLDGDGYPDLLFGHHDHRWADAYFNMKDGTFQRANWNVWVDAHGFTPFRFAPWQRYMHFIISRGGQNGGFPNLPELFSVRGGRQIVNVTENSGLEPLARGRGRSAVVLNLRRNPRAQDIIFTNARLPSLPENPHRAFRLLTSRGFAFRSIEGLSQDMNSYMMVTDLENDGQMEVMSYQNLRYYRRNGVYSLQDVTSTVLPIKSYLGTSALSELDFDNDGMWDIYVARSNRGELKWRRDTLDIDDRLLRNINGTHYIDVSEQAGIPRGTRSQGVTSGDFNNDGWTDLLIIRYDEPDLLLLNNGDGTFRTVDAGFNRPQTVSGDMAAAVDYDRNGKLDVIVSEGDWFDKGLAGFYRIMQNTSPAVGNYLLVQVRSSPTRTATSLHAVAKVCTAGICMMRRVGSPGTSTSNSYIELLHFGLGINVIAEEVSVRWVDQQVETKYNVTVGQLLTFG